MSDKTKLTSKNLSKLFQCSGNNSDSKLCGEMKGIPTVCTPVPSEEISILERESKRQLAKNKSESDATSAKKEEKKKEKKKKKENVITVKPCDSSPDNTALPSSKTPLTVTSCIDSSFLRYSVPIQIYFMQRRIGSTEIPTDGRLRLPLIYALKKVGNKIDNHYSFYLYASIFDVHWKRPRNSLMKQAASENNHFRTLLKPSTVDCSLLDISKLMELDEINNLNIYIFIKDINGEMLSEAPDNTAWTFENVFDNNK